jgi:hypothetical protein
MYSQPGYGMPGYGPPGYGGLPENLEGAGRELIGMRPWVMIAGICGIIGAVINLVQVLAAATMVGLQPNLFGNFISIGVALALAGLLLKFGSSIGRYQQAPGPQQMEAALEAQLAYWRLCGILIIIGLSLFLIIFLIGVAATVSR